MKKLILIVLLGMTVVGCTAEDIAIWKDSDRRMAERGVRCYRENGYYQCWDRYGNRTY
jgi:hypothetical protein